MNLSERYLKSISAIIDEMSSDLSKYVVRAGKDFTRKRCFSFSDVIRTILGWNAGTLNSTLLDSFADKPYLPTASAFVQQRNKIKPEAFETLFHRFTDENASYDNKFKDYQLLAADGSAIQIPTDPTDTESFFPGSVGQRPYNLLHLNTIYDLNNLYYSDAIVQKQHVYDEHRALVTMVDRSSISKAILIADRGYEGYNVMAHIQKKGWSFIIRAKDFSVGGIVHSLNLEKTGEFDNELVLNIRRSNKKETIQNNTVSTLSKTIHDHTVFDYIDVHDKQSCFELFLRIVRIQLAPDSYEVLITNLPSTTFSPDDIKMLYSKRWGIETSYRDLKYIVGLLHFHAKKVEYILQELFASLLMYNFCGLITSHITLPKKNNCKYRYKVDFSAAVHICKELFRGKMSPQKAAACIPKFLTPIRPDRHYSRRYNTGLKNSFVYRLA